VKAFLGATGSVTSADTVITLSQRLIEETVISCRGLPPLNRGAAPSCQILLIERLAYQRLDHRLSTDVQLFGGPVQFFQHARCQVNIHPLDRTHHAPGIGEEP
jgi:hypothetical protein